MGDLAKLALRNRGTRAESVATSCAIRREKTGRRLTSDPIRTSLGLLPSGPDPVGEWLVHRQSPGPYLGLKAPESKRGLCRHPRQNGVSGKNPCARDKQARGGIPDHRFREG